MSHLGRSGVLLSATDTLVHTRVTYKSPIRHLHRDLRSAHTVSTPNPRAASRWVFRVYVLCYSWSYAAVCQSLPPQRRPVYCEVADE